MPKALHHLREDVGVAREAVEMAEHLLESAKANLVNAERAFIDKALADEQPASAGFTGKQ